MRSYCLVGTEFQFYKMKRAVEIHGGNGCTMVCMYLTPVRNGYGGKFYVGYFTTIEKMYT